MKNPGPEPQPLTVLHEGLTELEQMRLGMFKTVLRWILVVLCLILGLPLAAMLLALMLRAAGFVLLGQ